MISPKDIDKLAELSRISMSEEEKTAIAGDIEKIVAYISELQNVKAKELNSKIANSELVNVMREDSSPHATSVYTKELLEAAPKRRGDYFSVKKIL